MSDKPELGIQDNSEGFDRYLVFFDPEALPETAKLLNTRSGISMTESIREAEFTTASGGWTAEDTIVLPALGVAICKAAPEQMARVEAGRGPIHTVRREFIFSIADVRAKQISVGMDYLQGYQDGVHDTIQRVLQSNPAEEPFETMEGSSFRDTDEYTWGLQAIGIDHTSLLGSGVKVAILDTGIDFTHQDFRDRLLKSQSFIDGTTTAQDDHGHGTHCGGTIFGPKLPKQGPRYGVAPDVELYVGKVMKENGKGGEADILHGLDWAIQNGCRIVSLSLGKAVNRGDRPLDKYEQIGKIALKRNCLVIAAAGNDSDRPGTIAPVTIPANSSSIMAVGALNRKMGIYENSNGGLNPGGGGIDLVAPGVEVYSSKLNSKYGTESGTSMATPHVAGIAALYMQADSGATAEQVWARLTQNAKRLSLSSTDVGSGLVQML